MSVSGGASDSDSASEFGFFYHDRTWEDDLHRLPPISAGWPPLAFHLARNESKRVRPTSTEAVYYRLNTSCLSESDTTPLLVWGALYVWSDGQVAREKGSVVGIADVLEAAGISGPKSFYVRTGFDEEEVVQVGEDEILLDVGKIFTPTVMSKLFDLCQTANRPRLQEGSPEPRQETNITLELPDYLKPDFTIILKGRPPKETTKSASPTPKHQRHRSLVVPASPLRKPVAAPPKTPQRASGHTRSSSVLVPTPRPAGHARTGSVQGIGTAHGRTLSTGTPLRNASMHKRALSEYIPRKAPNASIPGTTLKANEGLMKAVTRPPTTPSKFPPRGHQLQQDKESKEVEIAKFYVHTELLSFVSDYYASLFSGPWGDSKTTTSILTAEFVGTPFGLEQTLRMCYAGTSLNSPVLVPSVTPTGSQESPKSMPLFFTYDKATFVDKSDNEDTLPNFIGSLNPPQFNNYIRQCLSVLQPAEYLLLARNMGLDFDTLIDSYRIKNALIPLLACLPQRDFLSRLPLILFDFPQIDLGMKEAMKILAITIEKHWKKPMLSWPPALHNLLHDAIRNRVDEFPQGRHAPSSNELVRVFNSVGKLRRAVKTVTRQLGEWDEKVFGPVRTVLAEKILGIMEKSGHWKQVEGDLVGNEEDLSVDRLILTPEHAGSIVQEYESAFANHGGPEKVPMTRKTEVAIADQLLWGLLFKIRDPGAFEPDDLMDLLWRVTTTKGKDVVDRMTGEPVGGEGLLHAGNVLAVEKLLDAFVNRMFFTQLVGNRRRFMAGWQSQLHEPVDVYRQEVEVLRKKIETEKEKWKMGWVAF